MEARIDPIAELLADCATLPPGVLDAVFARYGHPLDVEGSLDPVLSLDDSKRLGRFSHRSPVDVIANDYFVLERAEVDGVRERLAVPGPLLAAAVAALLRKPAT